MNLPDILMLLDGVGFKVMSALLSVLWQSTLLFAAAGALAFFLRRKRETVRYAVWLAALLALPLLPLLSRGVTEIGAPKAGLDIIPTYSEPWKAPALPSQPVQSSLTVESWQVIIPNESPSVAVPAPAMVAPVISERSIAFTDYPWALAFLAYLLVVAGFLGGMLLMRIRIHFWVVRGAAVDGPRIMAAFRAAEQFLGLGCEYLVIEHPGIPAPLTCRILRPAVILPPGFAESLSDADLRAVALHELAHIQRRDTLTFTIIAFLRALFFFQPLVWYAARQVSWLAEVACDSAALAHAGNPVSYAELLTRIAFRLPDRALSTELAAGILLFNSSFFRRVREILSDRNSRFRRLSRRALAAVSALGVLAFLVAAALPLAEKDSGDTVTVSGTVLFKGMPVDGADIYLSDPKSEKVEKRTVSARDGQFSFRAERSELSGEQRMQPAVVAYKPGLPLGWMEFTRGVDPGAVVIEAREGRPINGMVRDSRGNPVSHAEVTVCCIYAYQYGASNYLTIAGHAFPPLTVVTAPDGGFTLQSLSEHSSVILLSAKAKGFGLDQQYYGREGTPGRIIFTLPPESRILGKVIYGDTGKPAANIRIRACSEKAYFGIPEAVTGRDGGYTLENLSAGVYSLCILPRDASDEMTAASRKDVVVKAGGTTNFIDFTLVKCGEIEGKVLDRDTGEPISGHWVGLKEGAFPEECPSTRYAMTDREGNFRLRAVPGPARIVSRAPRGYEFSEPVIREGEVTVGKTLTVEPLRFGKGITLRGMVRTLDGKPRAGVHIYGKGADTIWSVSDREGKFTISGLKKGERISLKAIHDEQHLRGTVALEARPDVGVDILLREYETVNRAGRIVDGAGKPVAGAKVQAYWWIKDEGAGYTYATVYTDDAGRYAFTGLISGETFDFSGEAAGYASPRGTSGDEFIAKSGMPPCRDITLFKADRWMEVHIDGPDGKPAQGAWVQCDSPNQSLLPTDENGNVRFETLVETMVNRINISHKDFGRYEFRHIPTNARSNFRLIRAEKYLSGKVVDSAGKPVKSAYVGVEPDTFESGLNVYSVETLEDGSFHLTHIAQDTVKVTINHKDYAFKALDGVRTNQKDLVITLESRNVSPAANAAKPRSAEKEIYPLTTVPRKSRIVVDGNFSDWNALPAEKVELLAASALSNENAQTRNPSSKDELSAILRCGSDGDFLYLAVDVRDNSSDFGSVPFDYLIMQDCVEILFFGEKKSEFAGQINVTLDSGGKLLLSGRDPITNEKYPYFWESVGVRAALKPHPGGYAVEIAVPWSVLAWSGWESGHTMGMNVRVYDWDRPIIQTPHLVEWSSEDGAGYKNLLGGLPKPANAAFRSRDLEKIHAALNAMQKKDWTQAENLLRKSGNTPWSKVLLAQVLFKSEKGKEGAETLKQALRENRSPAIRDWGLNSLMNSAYSLEGKGQYREAIKILEGVDFSGPKSYPLLRAMLQLARCYCLNSEYAKSEPILKQVMGSASEKQIQDIDGMVFSARQMQASVERMKTMK